MLQPAAADPAPRRYDDPLSFRLERRGHGQLDLGLGVHQCIGQHIARTEVEVLLQELAARVGTLALRGEGEREPNNSLRAWRSVPLSMTPAVQAEGAPRAAH